MEQDSIIIAASKKRISKARLVSASDIVRYAIGAPNISQSNIINLIGFNPDNESFPSTALEKQYRDQGWFALRTCSHEFFLHKIVPQYVGTANNKNESFWAGVIEGFRHGVILGESAYINEADRCIDEYADRLVAQLAFSDIGKLKAEYVAEKGGPTHLSDKEFIKDLMIRSATLHPDQRDALRATLDDIGEAHGVALGLGDYLIYSESEEGFWNNSAGWVSNRQHATPFDNRSDIFMLPGVNGDSVVVSYQEDLHQQKEASKPKIKM